MQKIIIDEEFRMLLPKLDSVTFESLEKNILEHGVRDPLVIWNDILIDGYNRYTICTKHNIPFTTISMEFRSRDEVLHWIIENQISRRNLTPVELSHFRGLYYNAAKRIKGTYKQILNESDKPQSGVYQKGHNTAIEVGKRFNVSKNTISRDSLVADALIAIAEISPDAKQKILSGEVPVDRNKLQRLSKAPKEEIEEVVKQINEGTYNRNDYRKKNDSIPAQSDSLATSNITQTPALNAPSLSNQDDTDYIDTVVSLITGNFNATLKSITNETGIPELKTSLRTLINSLEELYGNIKN